MGDSMGFTIESALKIAMKTLLAQTEPRTEYPFTSHSPTQAATSGAIGVKDRWIVYFKSTETTAVQMSMRDAEAQRDQQLTAEVNAEAEVQKVITEWASKIDWWSKRLSVYRLKPNMHYRVLIPVQTGLTAGQEVEFLGMNFLPYHGGYTIGFSACTLNWQEDDQADLLDNFDLYFEPV